MKRSLLLALIFVSLRPIFGMDQFPNGSTLKPENLICKKNGEFKCLSDHVSDSGELVNIPIDGISYEFKKGSNQEYDTQLYINGELYLEFSNHGVSVDELSTMMAEKIELTKSKGKESLVIPKITGNGNFFVGSPAFKFVLPVFDGPSDEEMKEYEIENKYKSEIRRLKQELEKSKSNNSDLEKELEIAEGRLRRIQSELENSKAARLDCENKLTQTDNAPIDLNRNLLNNLDIGLEGEENSQENKLNFGQQE